jgi:hypothetical protein
MAIEKREVDVAKEIDDVMKAVVEIVKDVKEKKSVADIAMENMQNLIDALSGVDQMGSELEENRAAAMSTVALRVAELADLLLAPKEEPASEEPAAPADPA